MKHNIPVIIWMASFFLLAQIIGLAALNQYIDPAATAVYHKITFRDMELAGAPLERPQVGETSSFAYITMAMLIGTGLMMILMKYQVTWLWKVWFGFAVVICLSLALSAFIPSYLALIIGIIVGLMKLYKPNWWIQTFTELFMYSGLAIIFVPIMNLTSGILLLIFISIYDAYAVWKSKHMISLATFQAKSKMFAGLIIPYADGRLKTHIPTQIDNKTTAKTTTKKTTAKTAKSLLPPPVRTAILGGGDIGFPLIFAGCVLKTWGMLPASVIPITSTIALIILFIKGDDGKFYPAMPFISAGCFVGLLIASFL